MKTKSSPQLEPARRSLGEAGFFDLRVLIASVLCLAAVLIALAAAGVYLGSSKAQAQPGPASKILAPVNSPGAPDVVAMVGPVRLDQDLRTLPYIPPAPQILRQRVTRYPRPDTVGPAGARTPVFPQFQSVLEKLFTPVATMPPPLLTFDGINSVESGCNCKPPDPDGDVGPNHYVQAVNNSFKIFDKNGNTLSGPDHIQFILCAFGHRQSLRQ